MFPINPRSVISCLGVKEWRSLYVYTYIFGVVSYVFFFFFFAHGPIKYE